MTVTFNIMTTSKIIAQCAATPMHSYEIRAQTIRGASKGKLFLRIYVVVKKPFELLLWLIAEKASFCTDSAMETHMQKLMETQTCVAHNESATLYCSTLQYY